MMEKVKQRLFLDRSYFAWILGPMVGLYLVGLAVGLVMMGFYPEDGFISVGQILPICAVFVYLMCSCMSYFNDYGMAIKMGSTRKRFVVEKTLSILLQGLAMLGGYLVLLAVDNLLYRIFFSGQVQGLNLFHLSTVEIGLIVVGAVAVVAYIVGAIIMRYGKKGNYAFLAVYLVIMMLGGKLDVIQGKQEPLNWLEWALHSIGALSGETLLIGGGLLVLGLASFSTVLYLRGTIKS